LQWPFLSSKLPKKEKEKMFALCRRIGYSVIDSNEIDDVYNAVKLTNTASYMKNPETPKNGAGGFIFCTDTELEEIKDELKIRDGSGSSLAFSLRNVQHLLKDQEDFVTKNFIHFETEKFKMNNEKFGSWDGGRFDENTLHVLKDDFKLQLIKDGML
jgi:hypothetical protein